MLELGCGDGGNLVPMAYGLPDGAFTGIDLSAAAIDRAAALRDALGLQNLDLRRADLAALGALGTFDFVIAHGVYSWVEPAARDALLAACRAHLAPQGVAYVSYDVFPGGHLREITRQMLRWHLRDIEEPEERIAQARALLTAVSAAGDKGDELRRRLAWQAEWALAQSDASIYHDELAEHHEAVLFTDFVAHAQRHGLRFLAEADVFEMHAESLPAGLAVDVIAREQYLDFFKGRMFRQTLLCHADGCRSEPAPGVVRGMLAAARCARRATSARGGSSSAARAARRSRPTTRRSSARWCDWARRGRRPSRSPSCGDDDAVGETLLRAYRRTSCSCTCGRRTSPPHRPSARWPARSRDSRQRRELRITSLRHASVDVPDALGRRLITLLDGTRDRGALLRELERPADELERSLQGLASIALLER